MVDVTRYALIGLIIYFSIDLLLLGINIVKFGRASSDWKFKNGPFLFTALMHEDGTTPAATSGGDLGEYEKYAGTDGKVNEVGIKRIIRDHDKNEVIAGYTGLEVLAYAIVPLVTFLAIAWWGISTRPSKSEWTFWILIGTLIYTTGRTLVATTGGDSQIIPGAKPPIDAIATKLGIVPGDELKYNFVARRGKGGGECMVEGDWPTTEGSPPIFRGASGWPECSMENLLF